MNGKTARLGCAVGLMVLLVAACGTQGGSFASPDLSGHVSVPVCPQADPVQAVTPCVSVGVQQEQQANQGFNARLTLPPWLAARAKPATQRVRETLDRLTPHQRLRTSAVQAALLRAGLVSEGLAVLAGPPWQSVTFGGYEPFNTRPAVCVWGTLTAKTVSVSAGGNTREGACLPTAGGH